MIIAPTARLDLVRANPDDDFWRVDAVTPQRSVREVIKRDAQGRIVRDSLGNPVKEKQVVTSWQAPRGPNTMSVFENGRRHDITFEDELLARAMVNLGVEKQQKFLGVMKRFMNVFKAMRTSYNPEFMLSNALRDAGTAAFSAFIEHDASMVGKIMADAPNGPSVAIFTLPTRRSSMRVRTRKKGVSGLGKGVRCRRFQVNSGSAILSGGMPGRRTGRRRQKKPDVVIARCRHHPSALPLRRAKMAARGVTPPPPTQLPVQVYPSSRELRVKHSSRHVPRQTGTWFIHSTSCRCCDGGEGDHLNMEQPTDSNLDPAAWESGEKSP